MDKDQIQVVRAVLRRMIQAAGVNDPTQLAKAAGLAHTTLTRIMSDKEGEIAPDITWSLSAKTWMKLSAASGVPVTFLGENIIIPSAEPRDGDIIKQPVAMRLLEFWGDLGPDERELIESTIDAWAERVARRKPR